MAEDWLRQFLGSNFHQDWDIEASTADEVITNYLAEDHSKEHLTHLSNRVLALLERHPSDDATLEHELLEDLGCEYYPPGDVKGTSTRQWLKELAARLGEEAARRDSPPTDS
jgi:hypothetical protein